MAVRDGGATCLPVKGDTAKGLEPPALTDGERKPPAIVISFDAARNSVRTTQGGTQKWCPSCREIQICTAVNPSQLGFESGQRWYRSDHSDIQWFRRCLVCASCGHKWLSAELPEDFLDELVELRNALRDIKANAEAYMDEAERASAGLAKLTKSLSVLRALRIYQEERAPRRGRVSIS